MLETYTKLSSALGKTPSKYAFLGCSHLDFESLVVSVGMGLKDNGLSEMTNNEREHEQERTMQQSNEQCNEHLQCRLSIFMALE